MHIDTARQGWQALQRCGFQKDNPYGGSIAGKVVYIGHYDEGVCAKVQFSGVYDWQWYCYSGGKITRMTRSPRGNPTGVIPPGCSP